MPIPVPASRRDVPEIPTLRRSTVQACRFSSWYPVFRRRAIRGYVHKFSEAEEVEFRAWFDENGMRLPKGVDEQDESNLSDSESEASTSSSSSSDDPAPKHSFPTLTSLIHDLISSHRPSGLFVKLNSTAPQDAQWILPLPQPMKCTDANDVFMVVKASGLMNGIMEGSAVAGLPTEERGELAEEDVESGGEGSLQREELSIDGVVEDLSPDNLKGERLEFVLKKWYDMDRSREFRLFVRGNVLIGISQRDSNHYPHLLAEDMQERIKSALSSFFLNTVQNGFAGGQDFVLDVYLNSALDAAHIIDISPYHPFHTSGFLFDYSELHSLYLSTLPLTSSSHVGDEELLPEISSTSVPVLRVIESRMHPAAARNSPAYPAYPVDVNMVGGGRDIEEFKKVWEQEVARAAVDGDEDD